MLYFALANLHPLRFVPPKSGHAYYIDTVYSRDDDMGTARCFRDNDVTVPIWRVPGLRQYDEVKGLPLFWRPIPGGRTR